MNNVNLTGRLTKDVEVRRTPQGTAVTQFTLAVRRERRVEGQPEADFVNCVAWQKTAELMGQYLHKGSQIGVEVGLSTGHDENQQGQRVYVTEVVCDRVEFLEPRAQAQPQAGGYTANQAQAYGQPQPQPRPQQQAAPAPQPQPATGGAEPDYGFNYSDFDNLF